METHSTNKYQQDSLPFHKFQKYGDSCLNLFDLNHVKAPPPAWSHPYFIRFLLPPRNTSTLFSSSISSFTQLSFSPALSLMAPREYIKVFVAFFLFLLCFTGFNACDEADKSALLAFKAMITHDPSDLLGTWRPSSDCCTSWDGVACDAAGRVVNISRPGVFSDPDNVPVETFMVGTLSPSLGDLACLQMLDLSNLKYLQGSVPPELGKLSRLLTLLLYSNNLTDPIPSTFSNLISLDKLSLRSNSLSGILPASVFKPLTSLSMLDLSTNALFGKIPATIGRLASLTHLDLRANKFSGSIPSAVGRLRNLRNLDLSENELTGSIPSSMGELSNLVYLDLKRNRLTGSIPDSFSKMASLRYLSLSENRLSGGLTPTIGAISSIRTIILEKNWLTGSIPPTIGNLTALAGMFFSNNRFTGQIPSTIGNLKNLQTLDLSMNHISGQVPDELAKLHELQTLDLSFNPLRLRRVPAWLAEVNLFCLRLAGTGLVGHLPIWLSSSSISVLDLSSNRLVGRLPRWIGNMSELSYLNLSNNKFHAAIPMEFRNLSLLMDLDLHSNRFTGHLWPIFTKRTQYPLGQFLSLDLSWNLFTGPLQDSAGASPAMASVESLILSHNPLDGRIPKSLGELPELRVVELASNRLSGGIPRELSECKHLRKIALSDNNLNGRIPEEVINMEGLQEFDVSKNGLKGQIPAHNLSFPAAFFRDNPDLCGAPLPPCKHEE